MPYTPKMVECHCSECNFGTPPYCYVTKRTLKAHLERESIRKRMSIPPVIPLARTSSTAFPDRALAPVTSPRAVDDGTLPESSTSVEIDKTHQPAHVMPSPPASMLPSVRPNPKRPRTELPVPSTTGEATPAHTAFSEDRLPTPSAGAENGPVEREDDEDEGGVEPPTLGGSRGAAALRNDDVVEEQKQDQGAMELPGEAAGATQPEEGDWLALAVLDGVNVTRQRLRDLSVRLDVQGVTLERMGTRLSAIEMSVRNIGLDQAEVLRLQAEILRVVSQGWTTHHTTHTVSTAAAASGFLPGAGRRTATSNSFRTERY